MTEYISSDTNVWIDFDTIGAAELPFRLPCTYVMWEEAIEDELVSPPCLGEKLRTLGLAAVKFTTEEFYLTEKYTARYSALSVYDAAALAIAKHRNILLMTGDRRLRNAALKEGVAVTGTIGVLDRLLAEGLIGKAEFRRTTQKFIACNGGKIRLPEDELKSRLVY